MTNAWLSFVLSLCVLGFTSLNQRAAAESGAATAISGPQLVEEFSRLMKKRDYLSARVLLKQYWSVQLTRAQWKAIRKQLHFEPKVGWEIVRSWDSKAIAFRAGVGAQIDLKIQQGDQLFKQKKYKEAFAIYMATANLVKKRGGFSENRYLYYDLVTGMARSLYASGDFYRAYRLYLWIPPIYPRYRQILFERTWASFRAGELEHALGDLIAQYSPYFNGVVNPEIFLVQIYVYKKLCRDQDLSRVLLLVDKFRKRLEENEFSVQQWASSDWEIMPLANLSVQERYSKSAWISEAAREQEKQSILNFLKKRYDSDRTDFLANLTKVTVYAKMAFDLSSKELPRLRELPDPATLIRQRLEMWPIDGSEDWLDEIGNKFFLGKSQCKKSESNVHLIVPQGPVEFLSSVGTRSGVFSAPQ